MGKFGISKNDLARGRQMLIESELRVKWVGEPGWEGYKDLCRNATKAAMTEAATVVLRGAKKNAYLLSAGTKHRTRRRYPGGRVYVEPKRLYQTLTKKVREQRDQKGVTAWVRSSYGYSLWVEYGTKYMKTARGTYSFLRRALKDNMGRVIGILKGTWPE